MVGPAPAEIQLHVRNTRRLLAQHQSGQELGGGPAQMAVKSLQEPPPQRAHPAQGRPRRRRAQDLSLPRRHVQLAVDVPLRQEPLIVKSSRDRRGRRAGEPPPQLHLVAPARGKIRALQPHGHPPPDRKIETVPFPLDLTRLQDEPEPSPDEIRIAQHRAAQRRGPPVREPGRIVVGKAGRLLPRAERGQGQDVGEDQKQQGAAEEVRKRIQRKGV